MKKTVDNVKKLGMAARSPETSEIYDLMTGDGVSEHQGKAALKAAASVFAKLLSFEIDCGELAKVPKKTAT